MICHVALIDPLKAELDPIRHLLELIGVHHILHISRIKVKSVKIFVITISFVL